MAMTTCTCLVQQGCISPMQRAVLVSGLREFARTKLGSPADVRWLEIAPGSGYTANSPSATSVVALTAGTALERSVRSALLHELVAFWTRGADCKTDEITAIIGDPVAG